MIHSASAVRASALVGNGPSTPPPDLAMSAVQPPPGWGSTSLARVISRGPSPSVRAWASSE